MSDTSSGIGPWGKHTNFKAPALIEGVLTPEQVDAYALHYSIRELTDRLQHEENDKSFREGPDSNVGQYDSFGRRTNTGMSRHRENLERERSELMRKALLSIPGYAPPRGFRWFRKTQEKIYLPAREYPHINFVGQLLGPRGKTLKRMQELSGARIAIRGRGSVKEGRSSNPGPDTSDDELHVLINAETESGLKKAIDAVKDVIRTATSTPESENVHKQAQLRELATLNGTLREDIDTCRVCGATGHKSYDCPENAKFMQTQICRNCGETGHFAKFCPHPRKTTVPDHVLQEADRLIADITSSKSSKHDSDGASEHYKVSNPPGVSAPQDSLPPSIGSEIFSSAPPGITPIAGQNGAYNHRTAMMPTGALTTPMAPPPEPSSAGMNNVMNSPPPPPPPFSQVPRSGTMPAIPDMPGAGIRLPPPPPPFPPPVSQHPQHRPGAGAQST